MTAIQILLATLLVLLCRLHSVTNALLHCNVSQGKREGEE